jgi:hypothetical protein
MECAHRSSQKDGFSSASVALCQEDNETRAALGEKRVWFSFLATTLRHTRLRDYLIAGPVGRLQCKTALWAGSAQDSAISMMCKERCTIYRKPGIAAIWLCHR